MREKMPEAPNRGHYCSVRVIFVKLMGILMQTKEIIFVNKMNNVFGCIALNK